MAKLDRSQAKPTKGALKILDFSETFMLTTRESRTGRECKTTLKLVEKNKERPNSTWKEKFYSRKGK